MYFDAKEFGKRLHDVRTSRGITQEELAVRLGLASKHHMPRWETDEAFFDKIRQYGKVSYARFHMLFGFPPASGRESVTLVFPHCRL